MEDKLVTFAKYDMAHEAEFTKDLLEDNGIRAVVVGDMLTSVDPYFDRQDCVEVKILQSDLEKAQQVVDEYKLIQEQQDDDEEAED